MKTVKLYTLGCKVNQYDTQSIRESFIQRGFKELENSKPADVYVINTCTVTRRADSESLNLVRRARRESPKAKIIVTGCLTELDADKVKRLCGVSAIVKNRDKETFFGRQATAPKGISFFKGHSRAFLKIQDGCDNFCSYCKVPLVRGRVKSKPLAEIIFEANRLVNNGFKEIVLTGICLGAYGRDFKPRAELVEAIEALERIPGLVRLRLSSIEESDISQELVAKISESKKLCRHLHIPLQSGDDAVLKRMNRNYTFKSYLGKILKIKEKIPGVAITTDVLVGFPGESGKNFQNTLRLVKEVEPLKTHIFPYSPRQGTEAYKFSEPVSPSEIKERISKLKALEQRCSLLYRSRFLNKKLEALIEERVKGFEDDWQGYTGNYIKVWAKSKRNLEGKIIAVKLKQVSNSIVKCQICP